MGSRTIMGGSVLGCCWNTWILGLGLRSVDGGVVFNVLWKVGLVINALSHFPGIVYIVNKSVIILNCLLSDSTIYLINNTNLETICLI